MWGALRSSEAGGALLLLLLFTTQALFAESSFARRPARTPVSPASSIVGGTLAPAPHPSGPGNLQLLGVNYGRVADNLPSPQEAVALIKSLGVRSVRILDADKQILTALANTSLEVVISVKNEEIIFIASDLEVADRWVRDNVAAFLPYTHIAVINVGNEIINGTSSAEPTPLSMLLIPAMRNILSALVGQRLDRTVKVTTSMSMDVLDEGLFPPSKATFRSNILPLIALLLDFLTENSFPFFLNVYPYFAWAADTPDIALGFAGFNFIDEPTITDVGNLKYYNLLDVQLDCIAHAMVRLGFHNVDIVVSETGWPSAGGNGASPANAHAYNQGLVDKVLGRAPSVINSGTPLRPNTSVPTYIYGLFNEDLKLGAMTKKNLGLFYTNGTQVYPFKLQEVLTTTTPNPRRPLRHTALPLSEG